MPIQAGVWADCLLQYVRPGLEGWCLDYFCLSEQADRLVYLKLAGGQVHMSDGWLVQCM